ncbi:MAG TPA: TIGR03619 family F420-dependent LLM class oxidoreductase [Acidimicrobiales bacterium]|nr:TIGR03619 family F420-dependent LLM class oxidoreductase [Acidimicrobiales bacterium]
MKVRVGFGLGTAGLGDMAAFGDVVDALEEGGWDSLWLSERITGPAPDPLVALAVAAGRTRRLKLGTSVLVLPGRNPVVLAKELASLDRLSGGRLLPAAGLGARDAGEHAAFAVDPSERGGRFDEALPLMRRLWTGETVTHEGRFYAVPGLRIGPRPVQDPLEVWLGGIAPAELRRVGRLGDGWLPSFITPEAAVDGRAAVEAAAAEAGRTIDPEHWGALVICPDPDGPLPDRLTAVAALRAPGTDAAHMFPRGPEATRRLLEDFVAVGFSKFVVVAAYEPADWATEIARWGDVLLPLQKSR